MNVNMTNPILPAQESRPSQSAQAPRPRLGALLVEEWNRLEKGQGWDAAVEWAMSLPKEEWLVLMEARRTGLRAR